MDPQKRPADIREAQKRHWTAVSDAWDRWLDWTEHNFMPVTAWLGAHTHWRPGANLLDIGCGPGYPALAAAAAIRPHGRVTAIDFSPPMIAAASRRAATAGLDHVQFHEMDAESLQFADETFDGAMSVCTLMFSPDPVRAVVETLRVLKRDGRFGIVVWDAASLNPFIMAMRAVMIRFIELPPLPATTDPGPFRFAEAGSIESVLQSGGSTTFAVEHLAMTFEFSSVEAYLRLVCEVTGWDRRIKGLSGDDLTRLLDTLADAVAPHCVDGRVRLGAAVRCVAGGK